MDKEKEITKQPPCLQITIAGFTVKVGDCFGLVGEGRFYKLHSLKADGSAVVDRYTYQGDTATLREAQCRGYNLNDFASAAERCGLWAGKPPVSITQPVKPPAPEPTKINTSRGDKPKPVTPTDTGNQGSLF